MEKELTPLKALENIRTLFVGSSIDLSHQLNIIENGLKGKEEIVETIEVLIQYHKGLWDWYWNKNQRDKRMEHFYKMQVLEDLLQMIGENTDGKDN